MISVLPDNSWSHNSSVPSDRLSYRAQGFPWTNSLQTLPLPLSLRLSSRWSRVGRAPKLCPAQMRLPLPSMRRRLRPTLLLTQPSTLAEPLLLQLLPPRLLNLAPLKRNLLRLHYSQEGVSAWAVVGAAMMATTMNPQNGTYRSMIRTTATPR